MVEDSKNSRIKKVLLDTNFLVYCARQKIDYARQIEELVSEAFEFVVPEQVIFELEKLGKSAEKLSDREAALLALKLVKHNQVRVVKLEGFDGTYADRALLSMLGNNYLATLDGRLKKKLPNVFVIEGGKKIILV